MRYLTVLAGILLASGTSAGRALADLVSNGGFETGDFTGWDYTSRDRFSFVGGGFVHGGSYAAYFGDLMEDGGGSISQALATTTGSTYTLSFWFAGDGDDPSGFSASVGGDIVFSATNPAFDPAYVNYAFNFTAASDSTLLEFDAYDDPSYVNLDDVSVILTPASVPEPASIVLMGLGVPSLIGLGTARDRIRRRQMGRAS